MWKIVPQHGEMLRNIRTFLKWYVPTLHSHQEKLRIFPENAITVTYKRKKNLKKKLISLSLFPKAIKENNCSIDRRSRRCYICKNFLVVSTEFTCYATKRKYKTRGNLICNTKNVIYFITCKCYSKQYIGSATGFKVRLE